MGADAFGEWLDPALELPLGGGRTVLVQPPSVADGKKILALAIQAELALGIVKTDEPMPETFARLLREVAKNDEHPSLGDQYAVLEQHHQEKQLMQIEVYSIFYWAKGKAYADALAELLWTKRDVGGDRPDEARDGGDADPKASTRPPLRSPSTGSVKRTKTAGSSRTVPSRQHSSRKRRRRRGR